MLHDSASSFVAKSRNALRAAFTACELQALQAPLYFTFHVVLVLMTVAIAALGISYEVNDDVQMTMIASGRGLSPAPDEHLVFTNVIIGMGLKQLYLAMPSVPWYGLYLLTIHLVSQVALLYCALTIGRRSCGAQPAQPPSPRDFALRAGLYLIYFVLVAVPLLNQLQFTTTAFIAAQAGIFLWLLAWQRRVDQPDANVGMVLLSSIVLLLVGSLVRWESLAMAAIVTMPAGFLLLRRLTLAAAVPCGAAALMAAALVAAAFAYDRSVYEQDPNWSGFRNFNNVRRMFNDLRWTSFTPETAPIFSQVGWSKNDHAMIERWFYDDPKVYSEENLTTIAQANAWNSSRLTPELWMQALRTIARHRAVLAVWIALPFIVAAVPSRRARQAIFATMAAAAAILILIIVVQKLPAERIYFTLLSFPAAIALLSFAWHAEKSSASTASGETRERGAAKWLPFPWRERHSRRFVLTCLVVAIAMGAWHQVRRSAKAERARTAWREFLNERPNGEQQLFVCFESAIPYEVFSPFDNLSSWSQTRLLSLLWTQRTPCHEETKRLFGISNLARALCDRSDIVVIAKPEHIPLFQTFSKEHYGADIEFVKSHEASRFIVGRFRHCAVADTAAGPSIH